MNKAIKYIPLLALAALSKPSSAQDVSININTVPASVAVGQSGYVLVSVCNVDASPVTAPANKLRPQISAPPYTTITGVTNVDGTPITGFTVLSQSAGPGNTVILRYNNTLANFDCVEFHVDFVGSSVGSSAVFASTLGFVGPQTVGNQNANDNSQSGITVTAPLPVSLTAFTAVKQGSTSLLNWNTALEVKNDGFEIERSTDGKAFSKIGMVRSKATGGNSDAKLDYSFTDVKPAQGINYYRLRQVDQDGRFEYSHVEQVSFDGSNGVKVYPNPASNSVTIEAAEDSRISILNIAGQHMDVNTTGTGRTRTINVSSLASGTYTIHIVNAAGSSSHKLVVNR